MQRRYGFLVFFLVLISALGSFVNDMFTPAMPAMRRAFDCSVPTMQLGLTFGMIGLGLGQLILGPVSDRVGRKPVLIGATALFVLAAVVSVGSPTVHFFIICRLFQGLGASGAYFMARTIPADLYQGRQLARIMALIGAINGFAPASAPVIGGFISDTWGWPVIFWVLAAVGVMVILLSRRFKESLPPARRTRGSLGRSLSGFKVLLRNRAFMIHSCFKGVSLGLLFAYISAAPFILQDNYGFSQTAYGIIVGVNALFTALGSLAALRFRRLKRAAHVGTLLVAVAAGGQAVALFSIHSFAVFQLCLAPMIFGMGMIFTAANTLAMNEGRARAGEASAILGVTGYVMGAIVSPLVGMGNILHSTAITFCALALIMLILNAAAYRLPADLNN